MKKITLQLKTVSNPKQKEKNSVGAAYLNLLKQQASHIKVFKPDMISKMSPQKSESSPKHFTIIPPKTDKKLFKNQKENIKGFNEENKTAKSTKNPTVHTLNLNLQVEKPQFLKENGSSSRQSENPLETTITSTKNIEDSQKILRILKFNCLNHTKKKVLYFFFLFLFIFLCSRLNILN